jgi:RecB family exonuclease
VPDGWELVGVEHRLGAVLLDQPMASFIGILDRLIRRGDEYVVQDFKTGKVAKEQYFLEDHQIPVYSELVVRNCGLDPDVRMRGERIYLAHEAKVQSRIVDRAGRDAAWWWAQHTAIEALAMEEEIRLGRRVPTARQIPLCDWCAYRKGERCPAWALSLPGAREVM